jgi:mono/diheme cytochrome c family protein
MRNSERQSSERAGAPRGFGAPARVFVALWLGLVTAGTWGCSSSEPPETTSTQSAPLSQVDVGHQVYARLRCGACHSLDGRVFSAPTFKGLYGKPVALSDGRTVIADDDYIRRSILDPKEELVRGYAPSMISYEGQLTGSELDALVVLIRSLSTKTNSTPETSP